MKKYFIIIGLILILVFSIILVNTKKKKDTIRVGEVAHSIFYAPMYVAIENKYFEEEGLNIELLLTSGADKVSAALLSNDIDVGFAGAESIIYIYDKGESNYFQAFAGLTKRDGQFIVDRKKEELNYNDLKGKEVVVGRKGGMPSLNFINALENQNINKDDVNINYSIDYAALSGAFISGVGDYVNLFEPNATKLENLGLGYIVSSVGKYSNEVPYTAFFARKKYIENNKDVIKKFKNAINKGLEYVKNHNEEDVAKTIINQFNDTSLNDLITIIKRYKDNDAWLDNTFITEKSFKNLQDIMINANLLDKYVDYNDLIINE